jgi:predicted nucleotidyltransferase
MKSEFGLKPEVLSKLIGVFETFPEVEKAVIYGSRAMGNFRFNSDIDLTLVGKKLNLTELFKIENELDELLLPYQIDMSLFHQIDNPELIRHIKEQGKILYQKKTIIAQ